MGDVFFPLHLPMDELTKHQFNTTLKKCNISAICGQTFAVKTAAFDTFSSFQETETLNCKRSALTLRFSTLAVLRALQTELDFLPYLNCCCKGPHWILLSFHCFYCNK